jgi:hypothetical protein
MTVILNRFQKGFLRPMNIKWTFTGRRIKTKTPKSKDILARRRQNKDLEMRYKRRFPDRL